MSEFKAIISNEALQQFGTTLGGVEVDVSDVESVLHVREGGFYSEITDASTASMVNVELDAGAFEHYHVDDAPLFFGINWTKLLEFLSKAAGDQPVQLEYNDRRKRLNVDIESADYDMALIDPDSIRNAKSVEEMDILADMTVDMKMNAGALSHGIDVCEMVASVLAVEADGSKESPVHFVAQGDTEDMRVRYGDSLEFVEVTDPTESKYSVAYLRSLTGVIPNGTTVRTRVGTEMPIRIDYTYADGDGDVIIMLAPRIDN